MLYTYRIRKDTLYNEDGKKYTAYGIEAIDYNEEVLLSIPDIFLGKQKAKHFVNLWQNWNIDFFTRLFVINMRDYFNKNLSVELLNKIKTNQIYM